MHLIFLPVVHTTDKKGNNIDKLACSEFWKEKDSYRRLQDAFYQYMTSHNFKLEKGVSKKETGREHIDIKEYKEITNFNKTKEKLQSMKLEEPNVPDITDININRLSRKRDEKILEEIIKPKDELIQKYYQDNLKLINELTRQAQTIEEAEKYQKERNKILADNQDLHNTLKHLEHEYKKKSNTLDLRFNNKKNELEKEFKNKEFDIEYKYKSKIKILEKENNHLHKIIDKFYETVDRFIVWICHKFGIGESKELIKNFQEETYTFIDPVKQLEQEERKKEWDQKDNLKLNFVILFSTIFIIISQLYGSITKNMKNWST